MEDIYKVRFARALGYASPQNKPEDCPQFLADFYDMHCRNYASLLSNRECPRTEWALLATMAQTNHKLQEQIDELKARLPVTGGDCTAQTKNTKPAKQLVGA